MSAIAASYAANNKLSSFNACNVRRSSARVSFAAPGVRNARLSRNARSLLICNVAEFTRTASSQTILCARFNGHGAAVSSAVIVEDSAEIKRIVTSSLDKTVALWTNEGGCDVMCNSGYKENVRLSPAGGPCFSMLLDRRSEDGLPDQLYLGNHARQVVAWVPPKPALEPGLLLDGHCGWVRALASAGGRWMFSAACNQVQQWDMARAVPSPVALTTLDRGDILALAATKEFLYTAGADGSLRAFAIGKTGELMPAATRPKAHNDRVTAIAVGAGMVFSSSYDGSIKAWDASTLEIVAVAPAAHNGERVHCLALGPKQVLYSGGGDKLVRRWSPALLKESAPALHAHNHSVRALAVGPRGLVVSGDKSGEVAVWETA